MMNYIKSELYRMVHSRMIYVTALGFAGAPLLLNGLLYATFRTMPDNAYSYTSFSHSFLISLPMFFCVAAFIVVLSLYEGDKKTGNMKNVVASGISRVKIFAGQIVVSLVACYSILITTLAVYILSARLLLVDAGPATWMDLVKEALVMSPIAISALILAVVVTMVFEKTFVAVMVWSGILYFIPTVFFYVGIRYPVIWKISEWMPDNFLSYIEVNTSVCNPMWDTLEGLTKCMVAGAVGIVVFGLAGLCLVRKKEI